MPCLLLVICLLFSCSGINSDEQEPGIDKNIPLFQIKDIGSIPVPNGYNRVSATKNSYTHFLRALPLKSDKTVFLYNGVTKSNQQAQYAVLELDRGTKDLQQCADAVMRLRAEYLYRQKEYAAIRFDFTNGFNCDFEHYAQGYRLKIMGNKCRWLLQKPKSYNYNTFRAYLDMVYAYAGTKSLHHQLRSIPLRAIHPRAVFIQTRNPYGHAVTVMDIAYNAETKDTIFLLSQSYMPAQDIHILINPNNAPLSPWYSLKFSDTLQTPEWTFTKGDLKEF